MSHQNVVLACAGARRRGAVISTVIFIALLGVFSSSAGAETAGETFPVSVTPEGAYANGEGTGEFASVSLSADGRYVAFESAATNLGEHGPIGTIEAFVKDLGSGGVKLVSRADGIAGAPAGEPGIGDLELSADGRFAIFTSAAGDLGTVLPGEDPSEQHVYRRDLQSGETTLVDRVTGAAGAILSRGAEAGAISADGRYVAFTAHVENLEDPLGDHTETTNAVGYVRDLQTGATMAVSRASGTAGEMADQPAEWLSISADGRYAAFSSLATNLVPGVDEGVWEQVYLRDLQTSTTSLVSQNALGEAGDRSSGLPFLFGAGGCRVAFSSIAFNLLEPSPLAISGEQVYVANPCASPPTMTLVSQSASEEFAPFAYTVAGGSGDGRYALFVAEFAGSACCHLYLRDLVAGQTSQLDRAGGVNGVSANQSAETFAISANGCRVVFTTQATNLYGAGPPEGPGGEKPWEVYARQLTPCVEPHLEPGAGAPSGKRPSPSGSSPTDLADMKIPKLSRRKLVLDFSGPAIVSVRVRRLVKEPRRHWKFLRTIAAATDAGGRIEVPLPDFQAGRYRFNVHLHGSESGVVRMLMVG